MTSNNAPLRICIFGSSSARTKDSYKAEAKVLGRLVSEAGHINVNGAGRYGCMVSFFFV